MNADQLASRIDHTILAPDALPEAVDAVVDEAVRLGCASVCLNGVYAPRARARLDEAGDHGVKLCVVAGFPLGATLPMTRAIESVQLAKAGAEEIDVVAFIPRLLREDTEGLRDDLLETTRGVRAVSGEIVVKVIVESALLRQHAGDDDARFEAMIASACAACAQSGCDYIKTSTGFHAAGGATLEAVQLMKKHAGALKIKAAGGVRTFDDAVAMLEAGADRLGCSSTAAILAGAPV